MAVYNVLLQTVAFLEVGVAGPTLKCSISIFVMSALAGDAFVSVTGGTELSFLLAAAMFLSNLPGHAVFTASMRCRGEDVFWDS